jgi:hypothetical protein
MDFGMMLTILQVIEEGRSLTSSLPNPFLFLSLHYENNPKFSALITSSCLHLNLKKKKKKTMKKKDKDREKNFKEHSTTWDCNSSQGLY